MAGGEIHVIVRAIENAHRGGCSSFYPPGAPHPNGRLTKINASDKTEEEQIYNLNEIHHPLVKNPELFQTIPE